MSQLSLSFKKYLFCVKKILKFVDVRTPESLYVKFPVQSWFIKRFPFRSVELDCRPLLLLGRIKMVPKINRRFLQRNRSARKIAPNPELLAFFEEDLTF